MYQSGDIILIRKRQHMKDMALTNQLYVIIDNHPSQIVGIDYDIICCEIRTFCGEQDKVLCDDNFIVTSKEIGIKSTTNKKRYIHCGLIYYFDLRQITFVVIGRINNETLEKIQEYKKRQDEETERLRQIYKQTIDD